MPRIVLLIVMKLPLKCYVCELCYEEAKRPRGRPRKVAKLEDSRESVAAETATSVSTIDDCSVDSRQIHSDWETAAAQILLGMSEVGQYSAQICLKLYNRI